jgi:hypothetical protein
VNDAGQSQAPDPAPLEPHCPTRGRRVRGDQLGMSRQPGVALVAAVYRVVVSASDPDHWSGVSRTRFLTADPAGP